MDCPTCLNDPKRSVVASLVNRGGVCTLETHPCFTCDGEGTITNDQFERMAAGNAVREARIQANLTIYDMSVVAGVSPRDVSDYERGRLPDDADHAHVRDALFKAVADCRKVVAARSR